MFIIFQDLEEQKRFVDFLELHNLSDAFCGFFKGSKYIQFWNCSDDFRIEFAYEILRNYSLQKSPE